MAYIAIAVYKTDHGKLYSRTFNPAVIDARHVQSNEVVWESQEALLGSEGYPTEEDAIVALLDYCPEEYFDIVFSLLKGE